MRSKSEDITGLFSQKNYESRTSGSCSNPGILLGFSEGERGNRSPVRAYFLGGGVPVRAQKRSWSLSVSGVERIEMSDHEVG